MFKKMLLVLTVAILSLGVAGLAIAQEEESKGPLSLSLRGNMINSNVFEDLKFEAETEFGLGVAVEYDLPWLKGLALEAAVDRLNLFDQEVYVREEIGQPTYQVWTKKQLNNKGYDLKYVGQLKYVELDKDSGLIQHLQAPDLADWKSLDGSGLYPKFKEYGDKHNVSFWKSSEDMFAYESTPKYWKNGALTSGYGMTLPDHALAEFDSTDLSLSLKYNFYQLGGKIVPYVLGGVGYLFNDFSLFDVDNSFETHAGAGVNYVINDSWAMYAEGRYLWSTADVSDTYADALGGEVELDSFIGMVGLKYRF